MITNIDLYFDPKNKRHCLTYGICEFCRGDIHSNGFIFEKYSRSKNITNKIDLVCVDCLGKNNEEISLYQFWSGKPFFIVPRIETSYVKVFFTPPSFKNSKSDLSVFDVADKQIGDEIVIDKTVHAGRLQSDYNPNLLEERDQALRLADEKRNTVSLDDPMDYLLELQSSGLKAIGDANAKKKKLLEGE